MQAGYDAMVTGFRAFRDTIDMPACFSSDEVGILRDVIDNDYPELFYFTRYNKDNNNIHITENEKGNTRLLVEYNISQHYVKQILHKYDKLAAKVIKRNIGRSDLETVANLHNYVAENCSYDYTEYKDKDKLAFQKNHCVLGWLFGNTVCEGFSKSFLYLLDRAGIPALVVDGSTVAPGEKIDHSWNMVGLRNGSELRYYFIDVTWNSLGKNKPAKWDYFLRSDQEMFQMKHFPRKDYKLPEANHSIRLDRAARRITIN